MIFNDKAYDAFLNKEVREDSTIVLRHGEPMIFGKNRDKGLILDGLKLKVVKIGENGITRADILVHNAHEPNPGIHMMLVNMKAPDMPVALGVIRAVKDHTYDDQVRDQLIEVRMRAKIFNMDQLLHSGETWEVK